MALPSNSPCSEFLEYLRRQTPSPRRITIAPTEKFQSKPRSRRERNRISNHAVFSLCSDCQWSLENRFSKGYFQFDLSLVSAQLLLINGAYIVFSLLALNYLNGKAVRQCFEVNVQQ